MRLLKILASLLAGAVIVVAAVAAKAQNYDADQSWIRRTIGPSHRHSANVAEHEHRFHKRQLYRKKTHHHHGYGHTYGRHKPDLVIIEKRDWRLDRDEALDRARGRDARDRESARQEKVYGYVSYGPNNRDRDILSNIGCLPAMSAISNRDYRQEEDAWVNAQRAWESIVRWRIGERFANVANADKTTLEKICSKTSIAETATEKFVEGVSRAVGGDGYKIRCEIRAQPCPPREERSPQVRD